MKSKLLPGNGDHQHNKETAFRQNGGKIICSYILNWRLISRIYKEYQKLKTAPDQPINTGANEFSGQLSKKGRQKANNCLNKCAASLGISETQIKAVLRSTSLQSERLSLRKSMTTNADEEMGKGTCMCHWEEYNLLSSS